jgi:ribosomal protein L7/L12
MNNTIALKALKILANEHDVDLSGILTEFANKDAFCTHAVLEAVSKASQEVGSTTTEVIFRGFLFTDSDIEQMREQVVSGGKIPAVKLCREISRFGLKDAKECVEELFAKEITEYRQSLAAPCSEIEIPGQDYNHEWDTLDFSDDRLTGGYTIILCPDGIERAFKEFGSDGSPIVYGNVNFDNPVEDKTFHPHECKMRVG